MRVPAAYALAALSIAGCTVREVPAVDSAPQRAEAAFRARLGREWTLVRMGADVVPPPRADARPDTPGNPPPGRPPTIRFAADPALAGGRSFCNDWGAPWVVHGDSLHVGGIESSAVGCDGPDSLETRFFRALRAARRFAIARDTLLIVAADGTRLTFVAAPATRP